MTTVGLAIALAASWLVIGILLWLLYLLTKRHGRTLAAYRQLTDQQVPRTLSRSEGVGLSITESTILRNGLTAGTRAPDFSLPDLEGNQRSLKEFAGKRILLVFSDPDCGPCQSLAPTLQDVHQRHRENNLVVLMVSRGETAINWKKAEELGLSFPIVLQKRWEISKEYAMFATPIGYLIDEKGTLASGVAIGAQEILGLIP